MSETLIAIVDDDPLVRAATASLLRSCGYSTREFASGRAFLEGDVDRFACLVSDVQMPEMTGVELCQRLVDREATLPMVLMTAYPRSVLERQAGKAGVAAVLEKPIDSDAFLAIVEAALA